MTTRLPADPEVQRILVNALTRASDSQHDQARTSTGYFGHTPTSQRLRDAGDWLAELAREMKTDLRLADSA